METVSTNYPFSAVSDSIITKVKNDIRYNISLEAPTAAAQKLEEPPLTYLNKGQFYVIHLKDNEKHDSEIISTVVITFHDESHRASAADFWKFWLTQQKETENIRAIELDITKCSSIQPSETNLFDRVAFRWNGKLGCTICIRFNCLSTDFSRIKGVKGIPLRLHIESRQSSGSHVERTFCRIKLFRDKGAERKNKDDAKHIERQLEKIRGKNGESHPFWLAYTQIHPVTVFTEKVPLEEENTPVDPLSYGLRLSLPSQGKRRLDSYPSSIASNSLGFDPTYVPQRRRRIAKLSLLIRFSTSEVYRVIYLEHLTVKELTNKIMQRMSLSKPVVQVMRKTRDKVIVVDDEVVHEMEEEQDILIETQDKEDGIMLLLCY